MDDMANALTSFDIAGNPAIFITLFLLIFLDSVSMCALGCFRKHRASLNRKRNMDQYEDEIIRQELDRLEAKLAAVVTGNRARGKVAKGYKFNHEWRHTTPASQITPVAKELREFEKREKLAKKEHKDVKVVEKKEVA